MRDDAIVDLVRTSLTDLASEARPVDLTARTQRRLRRRRTVSMSIGAVCAVAALLVGVPVVVAAGVGAAHPESTPISVTRSASVPDEHRADPTLSDPAAWTTAVRR